MADGVDISAGSGTKIATDDAGASGHVQIIKLAISADGSATVIPADATNGLDVDVTRVIPGTTATALGKAEDAAHASGDTGVMVLGVRNDANADISGTDLDYTPFTTDAKGNANVLARRGLKRVSVQSSGLTTATTAYVAGDQVGAQFTIAGAARESGGGGTIVGVMLIDAADIIGQYDVVFFDSSVTPASDNAAFAISDSDALKLVGLVPLVGAYDLGNNRVAQSFNLAIPYVLSGSTNLYACLICRSGHTFFGAATNLQLVVLLELN